MLDVLLDALIDTLKTIPFLFVAYLVMEYIEHKSSDKMLERIRNSKVGPIAGALFGLFPQCGFSASAAGLFSGGVITAGTLIAVFLSTSDEMLPIFISEQAPVGFIFKVLGAKFVAATAAGLIIDLFLKSKKKKEIHDMCHDSGCHCDEHEGILVPSLIHTAKIAGFILIVSFLLNTAIYYLGEDKLAGFILNKPFVGNLLSAVIGLIPNCAASVVITQLYLNGAMSAGALLSGLFVSAGIGLVVLFRTNKNVKENLRLTAILYVSGVVLGSLIGLIPIW